MKRLLAFAALLPWAGAALAADLPPGRSPAAPSTAAPPPVFLFQGFYVGAQAGALRFADRTQDTYALTGSTLALAKSHGDSFTAGLRAGYDWRYDALVLGVVGDLSGARAVATAVDPFGVSIRNELGLQFSLRGRAGFTFDRFLVYGTAGLNYAQTRHKYDFGLATSSKNYFIIAPTVGAGIEYAITDHWSVNLEYRVSGAGARRETSTVLPGALVQHGAAVGETKIGLNYRF